MNSEYVKLTLPIPKQPQRFGTAPYAEESIWLESVGGDEYRVASVPLYVAGIGFDDVIDATYADTGQLQFRRSVRSANTKIFHVQLLADKNEERAEDRAFLYKLLESIGCKVEADSTTDRLATSLSAEVDLSAVERILGESANEGILVYLRIR